MHEIVIATRNKDKFKEMAMILSNVGAKFIFAGDIPSLPEIVEDGDTLYENALKKAKETARFTGKPCFADDTGFFVRALNGEPGIHAAIYAGKDCSYEENVEKLLSNMIGQTDNYAYFQTVTVLYNPVNDTHISGEGTLEGHLITERRGTNGFGYDPIFVPLDSTKTLAEMNDIEKCCLSHRFKSLDDLNNNIKKMLGK